MDIQKAKEFGIYSVGETFLGGEVAVWVTKKPKKTEHWTPDEAIAFATYIIAVAVAIKEEETND